MRRRMKLFVGALVQGIMCACVCWGGGGGVFGKKGI